MRNIKKLFCKKIHYSLFYISLFSWHHFSNPHFHLSIIDLIICVCLLQAEDFWGHLKLATKFCLFGINVESKIAVEELLLRYYYYYYFINPLIKNWKYLAKNRAKYFCFRLFLRLLIGQYMVLLPLWMQKWDLYTNICISSDVSLNCFQHEHRIEDEFNVFGCVL